MLFYEYVKIYFNDFRRDPNSGKRWCYVPKGSACKDIAGSSGKRHSFHACVTPPRNAPVCIGNNGIINE